MVQRISKEHMPKMMFLEQVLRIRALKEWMPTLGRGYAWLMMLCWLLAEQRMRFLQGTNSKHLIMVLLRSGLKRIAFSLYRSMVKFSLLILSISLRYLRLSCLSSSMGTFSRPTSTFSASILPLYCTAIGMIRVSSLLMKESWFPTSSSNSSSRRLMTRNCLKLMVSWSGVAWKRQICPETNSITSRERTASERRTEPSKFTPRMRYSISYMLR